MRWTHVNVIALHHLHNLVTTDQLKKSLTIHDFFSPIRVNNTLPLAQVVQFESEV